MWAQNDSGSGMNWQSALAWVQTKNTAKYLGHNDWRLPNVKELQSIVDYTRSPDTTGSAAISPVFTATDHQRSGPERLPLLLDRDDPCQLGRLGAAGAYVAFGRGLGYMNGAWVMSTARAASAATPRAATLTIIPPATARRAMLSASTTTCAWCAMSSRHLSQCTPSICRS